MMIDFEMNIPFDNCRRYIGKWDWVHLWWKVLLELNLEKGLNLLVYQEWRYFPQNPVRKEEVLGATELYTLRSVSDPEYILLHTIFIFKDKGANRTSALEQWIETYRESAQETPTSRMSTHFKSNAIMNVMREVQRRTETNKVCLWEKVWSYLSCY
jgi:hypothetical protein